MDLGMTSNFTISVWPRGFKMTLPDNHQTSEFMRQVKESLKEDGQSSALAALGISGNWFGDERYNFPSIYADSLNEKGLSCGLQALVGTKYEAYRPNRINVFAGFFCYWATRQFSSIAELQSILPKVQIFGPDAIAQHFILHDATGAGMVVEVVNGEKQVYVDLNDNGATGFGVATNEPTFDWHLDNIHHYEWKRTLARQAVAIPGNFYPEERFLRIHMVKQGMANLMSDAISFQTAFALTVQVMNTVTVPMGDGQYGTDSGDSSGEGDSDHTMFGIVRDHADPTLYWRDSLNPSFRKVRLLDFDITEGASIKSLTLETGPFFIDMSRQFL